MAAHCTNRYSATVGGRRFFKNVHRCLSNSFISQGIVVSSPSAVYSPKQVAEALQVSESSVKRWCDRGLISMIRTGGGHRRITLDELMRFVNETERPLLDPMAIGLSVPPGLVGRTPFVAGMQEQELFRYYLTEGDEKNCRKILDQLVARSASPTQVCEQLITNAMHRFGEAWERNELDIYQERRGCDICQRLVFHLSNQIRKDDGPCAIGGSTSGDPYQLPTSLVELALREAGWSAQSLGADIPFASFHKAIADQRPRLVWLSISTVTAPETFIARFNQLADHLPEDCTLLVGGRALTDSLRPQLRYTAYCDNLRQLIGLAEMMRRRTVDLSVSAN
jgi:excisionase family DNA binding protein